MSGYNESDYVVWHDDGQCPKERCEYWRGYYCIREREALAGGKIRECKRLSMDYFKPRAGV